MSNKLHNGNTEALPLIRKEKTIAFMIHVLVFYQSDAVRQQCFPAVRYMVRQSSYLWGYRLKPRRNNTFSADEDPLRKGFPL